MDGDTQNRFPIDYAGKQETSLMLAFYPKGVDRERISTEKWYTQYSKEASIEYGISAK